MTKAIEDLIKQRISKFITKSILNIFLKKEGKKLNTKINSIKSTNSFIKKFSSKSYINKFIKDGKLLIFTFETQDE